MTTDRAIAHGRAAHAALTYLHGRRVKSLSMADPPVHYGMPEPKTRKETEESIRLLLAPSVGEMLSVGGEPRDHVVRDRPEVAKALELAHRIGPGDPVDHLEPIYDSVVDTLTSPRIWSGVARLAEHVLRHRSVSGDRVAKILREGMDGRPHRSVAKLPPSMRRIYVRSEAKAR